MNKKGDSRFLDGVLGFSVQLPDLPIGPQQGGSTRFIFFGPPEQMICSNINLTVEHHRHTRSSFRSISIAQFQAAGFRINIEQELEVSGREAVLFDYEGEQGGQALRFLSLAVIDTDRVFLLTCTAAKAVFPSHESEFRQCIESFCIDARKEETGEEPTRVHDAILAEADRDRFNLHAT